MKTMIHEIIQACTGDHGLNVPDGIQQHILSFTVQFRKNIIQQKDRLVARDLFHKFELGQL